MITGTLRQMAHALVPDVDFTMAVELTNFLDWFHNNFPEGVILLHDLMTMGGPEIRIEWSTHEQQLPRTDVVQRAWSKNKSHLQAELNLLRVKMRLSP